MIAPALHICSSSDQNARATTANVFHRPGLGDADLVVSRLDDPPISGHRRTSFGASGADTVCGVGRLRAGRGGASDWLTRPGQRAPLLTMQLSAVRPRL